NTENVRHLPRHFFGLFYAAETTPGGAARFVGRQPLLHVLLCRFGQVTGDLVVDLAIDLTSTKEGPQSEQDAPQAGHDGFSEMFRKRSTMLAARCHCASSLWSCLRPAA